MISWKDLGKIIGGKGLPLVGKILGGDTGEDIGEGIAAFLGVDATPDAISAAIENDPEMFLQLQKYQLDNNVELQNIRLKELGLYLDDRQAARNREIAKVKKTGKADKNMEVLGWVIVAGFFIVVIMAFFVTFPESNREIIYLAAGALFGYAGAVVQYYFGSSKGSTDKSKKLGELNGK